MRDDTLQRWISTLATDAVRTQAVFSAAFLGTRDEEPSAAGELLYLRQTSISARFISHLVRTKGVELRCLPLNLNCAIRFRMQAERQMQICLDVVQYPVGAGKIAP